VLAWLALRIDEPRFQLAAVAYLLLAIVHALAFEAPPARLFEPEPNPGSKLWALAATALLAAAFGLAARRWEPLDTDDWGVPLPREAHDALQATHAECRRWSLAPAAVLSVYAVSLATLQIAYSSRIGSFVDRFAWAHALDSILWAFLGLALVVAFPRARLAPRVAGLVLLGLSILDVLAYQQAKLPGDSWTIAAVLIAAAVGAAGLVDGLRSRRDPSIVGAVALLVAGALATDAVLGLADTHRTQGLALLGLAVVLAASAAAVLPHRRNLATILWVEALALTLAALPLLLHGTGLVAVYAALSVGLASLAAPAREPRLRLAALAPLIAAAAITLSTLATPRRLYVETGRLWTGLFALAIVLAALAAVLALGRRPITPLRPDSFDYQLAGAQPHLEDAALWALAVLALFAASLGILQLARSAGHGSSEHSFEVGRTALTGVWAVLGTALVVHGGSLRRLQLRLLGFGLLGFAVVDAVAFEAAKLPRHDWATATLLLATACCLAGLVEGLRSNRDPSPLATGSLLVAGGLATAALVAVVHGRKPEGLALLGLAVVAVALSAPVHGRRRNLAAVLWLEALVLTLAALPLLFHDTGLVAVLAVLSVGIALVAPAAHEPRLRLAALAPLAGAAGITVVTLATPRELFVETHGLWRGLLALLLVFGALACLLATSRPIETAAPDRLDEAIVEARPRAEIVATWTLAVLALYTASIAVLQLVMWSGASYQGGQAAVSAVWSLIALGALTLGLVRDLPIVRLTGFAMIGVTLAKIFFYDLGSLSATTRALSFLAVGAVLLVSGFFYQRLTARQAGGEAAQTPPTTVPR
jgi:hypothetical protein